MIATPMGRKKRSPVWFGKGDRLFCFYYPKTGNVIPRELARGGCESTDRCGFDRASFIGERWIITEGEDSQVGKS
jgi:hypothetical protein